MKYPLSNQRSGIASLYWIACLIPIVLCYFICNTIRHNRLLEDHVISNGATVLSFDTGSRHRVATLTYSFEVHGLKYSGSYNADDFSSGELNYFVGRHFPVVYQRNRPGNSYLLLTEGDFKEFKMGYPDSLKWVLVYIHK